jgi:hypothetical protein
MNHRFVFCLQLVVPLSKKRKRKLSKGKQELKFSLSLF